MDTAKMGLVVNVDLGEVWKIAMGFENDDLATSV
jgi:hypothetical protein